MTDTIKNVDNVIPRRRASDWTKPDTSPATLTEHADGSATLSRERLMVCLESAWELESLANLLPGIVACGDEVSTSAHFVVRGLADRIKRLSCVLISGLHDDAETVETLARRVFVGGRASA